MWIANYLDVVEFVILVTLESVVHMAHCLACLVPECDQGVLYMWLVNAQIMRKGWETGVTSFVEGFP